MDNSRRGFLKKLGLGGAAVVAGSILPKVIAPEKPVDKILDKFDISINGQPLSNFGSYNEAQIRRMEWHKLDREISQAVVSISRGENHPKEFYAELKQKIQKLDKLHELDSRPGYEYYQITNNNIPLAEGFYRADMGEDVRVALDRGLDKDISVNTKASIMVENGDWCVSKGLNNMALEYYQGARMLNRNVSVKRKIQKLLEV